MAEQVGKKFTWMIDDFLSFQTEIYYSVPILIGDCKWCLAADKDTGDSLYMGLGVADPKSLPSGWRRYVKLRLSVLNKYSGELAFPNEIHLLFDQKNFGWKFSTNVPLNKLHNESEGFQVNGEVMIVAEVKVHELVGTYDCSEESEGAYQSMCEMKLVNGPKPCDLFNLTQESIDVNGFQVLPSQINSVKRIFERHPDIASGFHSKNQHLRITSMNFLLSLIETLCQSLEDLSSEDLVDVDISLTYLKDVGFEVDWLERKLDQVKAKKEKEQSSLTRLVELKKKYLDIDALVEKEEAELSATRIPLSFDDVV